MKYFTYTEFDCPTEFGSGKKNMNKQFLNMIDYARDISSKAFIINSGYRSPEHNRKVGGSATSSHLKGCAADISCTNSADRQVILTSLIKAGFTRIGIAKRFIHVDSDTNKPDSTWLY